jgi:hypothetical protein
MFENMDDQLLDASRHGYADMIFPKKYQYGDTNTIFLIKIKTKANIIVVSLTLCHLLENEKEMQRQ